MMYRLLGACMVLVALFGISLSLNASRFDPGTRTPLRGPTGGFFSKFRNKLSMHPSGVHVVTHERHHEHPLVQDPRHSLRDLADSFNGVSRTTAQAPTCGYGLSLAWRTRIGSTILQTPLISPHRTLVVTPHKHYIEHLDGKTGSSLPPFPLTHPSLSSLASPLLYDLTRTGKDEVLVSTYDGLVFGVELDSGRVVRERVLWIPGLQVEEGWFEGLDESVIDVTWEDIRPPKTGGVWDSGKKAGSGNGDEQPPIKLGEKVLLQVNKEEEVVVEDVGVMADRLLLTQEAKDSLEKVLRTARKFMSSREQLERIHDENPQHAFLSKVERERMELYYEENKQEGKIFVDAHILSTPVIVDIDNDGIDEIIIAVSYFFDKGEYFGADVLRMNELPVHVDLNQYVAGGIVCARLDTLEIKWTVQLDLTTRSHEQTALIYASPTVIDFDANGSLDILISNSLGYIYALNNRGEVHEGFPIVELVEIQGGQIFADDLTGDGFVEHCAVDVIRGPPRFVHGHSSSDNIAELVCFNHNAERVWARRLSGLIDHAPVVADVNGDGELNMVLATRAGDVYVLEAATGLPLEKFPMHVSSSPIRAPVTLVDFESEVGFRQKRDGTDADGPTGVDLKDFVEEHPRRVDDEKPAEAKKRDASMPTTPSPTHPLAIVVPSVDGLLHIVNPVTMCHDQLDLGDESYSRVLVDDLTNNGLLDLVATTHSGFVHCLSTQIPYHPLRVTNGFPGYDAHGFSYREGYHGIFVPEPYRNARDIVGETFILPVEIVDERKLPRGYSRSYHVRVWGGKVGYFYDEILETAGVHRLVLEVPELRGTMTIHVSMMNEHGQRYSDSFIVSFNVGFLGILKWAVVFPFFLAAALVVCLRDSKESGSADELPS